MCDSLGKETSGDGTRIFHGAYADVYLRRIDFTPGYSVAIWNRTHVTEPTELTDAEAAGYWLEVLSVARAIERHYSPAKMNYQTLGNALPHLHTHIMPRYLDDPAPGAPLGFPNHESGLQDEKTFKEQVRALRQLLDYRSDAQE